MTNETAQSTNVGSNDGLGLLLERESIAKRKADAAALLAVARQAGIAVQADDFGRGTFLFSDVQVLRRMLDAAKNAVAAEEREDNVRLRDALEVVVKDWTEQFERAGHLAPGWVKQARAALAPNVQGEAHAPRIEL